MEQEYITAEVFRIIRNNQDQPRMAIMSAIKNHLPDASDEEIRQALKELAK